MRIHHIIRQLMNGTRAVNNNLKYMVICLGVAVVHFFFAISFGVMHIVSLSVYNVAATIFYLFHAMVTNRKKQYIRIYVSTLVEVLFHSSMASLLVGWECGFMIYTIAIVPIAFYMFYTLPNHEGSIEPPVLSSAIVMICYFLVLIMCGRIEPLYQEKCSVSMQTMFYHFNTMFTFVLLLVFSSLFAMEIRYMQRRLEQENYTLGEIAKFDPLTHLLNRRSMTAHLHQAAEEYQKQQKAFCLIMADIDDFKKINDTYGHDCGDEVLIAVSHIISDNVRENDYVCRWGGEEILILVEEDLEICAKMAERICRQVAEKRVSYKGREVHVTMTLGVADYESNMNIRSAIENADRKLYQGKRNGKNQVVI